MTRTKGSKNIPWASIVTQLRRHPDRWLALKELSAVPERTIDVIRNRQRAALRLSEGTIRVERRATARDEDGTAIVALMVKLDTTRKRDS